MGPDRNDASPPRRSFTREAGSYAHAEERAEQMLLGELTPAQRLTFEQHGSFLVVSQWGNTYEIRRGRMHNVYRLDRNGGRVEELCCHAAPLVPNPDNMLAQKLQLEYDEAAFRRLANISDPLSGRMLSESGHDGNRISGLVIA